MCQKKYWYLLQQHHANREVLICDPSLLKINIQSVFIHFQLDTTCKLIKNTNFKVNFETLVKDKDIHPHNFYVARIIDKPARYACKKSKCCTFMTYIALFRVSFCDSFLYTVMNTKICLFPSTWHSSCIPCILFTNFGVDSSNMSFKQLCKCHIVDMINF